MRNDPCPVDLRGIAPAINTPFTAAGEIDHGAVRKLVDFLVRSGCSGVLVPGVAAEVNVLDPKERRALVETVLDASSERLAVLVGVSGLPVDERNRVIASAKKDGAYGFLYNPTREEQNTGLAGILSEISDAGAELIMLQDLDWTGSGMDLELIVDLFERVPAFKALKLETVPAGPKYSQVLAATEGRLHVSGGWAAGQMIEGLRHGVHAFMPCGMEPVYCEVFRRFQAGEHDAARALFEQLLPIIAFANQHISVGIRFKKMLRHADGIFPTDSCRAQIPAFDAVQMAEAKLLVKRAQTLQQPYLD